MIFRPIDPPLIELFAQQFTWSSNHPPVDVISTREVCSQTSHCRWSLVARPVERAAVCMLFLQSAVNPLVYGVMNRNFREVFKNLLRYGASRR